MRLKNDDYTRIYFIEWHKIRVFNFLIYFQVICRKDTMLRDTDEFDLILQSNKMNAEIMSHFPFSAYYYMLIIYMMLLRRTTWLKPFRCFYIGIRCNKVAELSRLTRISSRLASASVSRSNVSQGSMVAAI